MKLRIIVFVVISVLLALSGCTAADKAQQNAQIQSDNTNWYVPANPLDPANYNRRLQRLDDPTTILWCTYYPPTPGYQPITFAIQGKLTSSGKRPFEQFSGSGEKVDAQGMYGTSTEYRYGFSPDGTYWEVYSDGICTDQPTLVMQGTIMITSVDPNSCLALAEVQARDALKTGDAKKASEILNAAITGGCK